MSSFRLETQTIPHIPIQRILGIRLLPQIPLGIGGLTPVGGPDMATGFKSTRYAVYRDLAFAASCPA